MAAEHAPVRREPQLGPQVVAVVQELLGELQRLELAEELANLIVVLIAYTAQTHTTNYHSPGGRYLSCSYGR